MPLSAKMVYKDI